MSNTPSLGSIVQYTLTQDDAQLISSRRMAQPDAAKGNPVHAGQVCPAMIVGVYDEDTDTTTPPATAALGQTRYAFEQHPTAPDNVNLQVFLDGYDQHWATDIRPATDEDTDDDAPADATHGTYHWPTRS